MWRARACVYVRVCAWVLASGEPACYAGEITDVWSVQILLERCQVVAWIEKMGAIKNISKI